MGSLRWVVHTMRDDFEVLCTSAHHRDIILLFYTLRIRDMRETFRLLTHITISLGFIGLRLMCCQYMCFPLMDFFCIYTWVYICFPLMDFVVYRLDFWFMYSSLLIYYQKKKKKSKTKNGMQLVNQCLYIHQLAFVLHSLRYQYCYWDYTCWSRDAFERVYLIEIWTLFCWISCLC